MISKISQILFAVTKNDINILASNNTKTLKMRQAQERKENTTYKLLTTINYYAIKREKW